LQNTNSFISAFSKLGQFLRQFPEAIESDSEVPSWLSELNKTSFQEFATILENETILNPWFTSDSLMKALKGISAMLEEKVLTQWLEPYGIVPPGPGEQKTVGLIMAGNIPLVGFHDMMSVLAAGHRVLAKPSSKDDRLIRKVIEVLTNIDPELGNRIALTENKLSGMDAVIATGNDNSARYFEYYFRELPHIIRKNRNGVAVLTGQESGEELIALGHDIFTYFGMGCRNVTKLYIPETYDLKILMAAMDNFQALYQHHKYGNNVDYYRTIYLMNQVPLLDNGILLLKEDPGIASPVGVVFYERYSDIEYVQRQLSLHQDEIQCIVSRDTQINASILPGTTQEPMPWDYADGVDTIRFLMDKVL
jgi:hypothetical protein